MNIFMYRFLFFTSTSLLLEQKAPTLLRNKFLNIDLLLVSELVNHA